MKNKRVLYFLSFFILIFFTHCKKDKIKYYDNGNKKNQFFIGNDFFKNIIDDSIKGNNDKLIYHYLKKIRLDSSIVTYSKEMNNHIEQIDFYYEGKQYQICFYNNGSLKREGLIKNGLPISQWKFYSINEDLELEREYKIIKGERYINQEKYFNLKHEIIYEGNGFFELNYKNDTIKINQEFKAIVNLPISFHKNKNSKILVCLSDSDSIDFNEDFSNEDEINKVYFYDDETNKINKKWITGVNYNHSTVISKKFSTSGNKIINGIIIEYLKNRKDSINQIHKKYFSIPVYVLPD